MDSQVLIGPVNRLSNIIKYIIKGNVIIASDGTSSVVVESGFFVADKNRLVNCTDQINYIRANVLTNADGDKYIESAEVYISSKDVTSISLLTLSLVSEDSSSSSSVTMSEIQAYVTYRLTDYLTGSDLDTLLADYIKSTDLSNYITEDSLTTHLANYVTVDALSNYLTSADLSDYVKTADLANYVTNDDLSSFISADILADYVKTEDLADYVKSDALTNFITADDLTDYLKSADLSNYVTTDSLASYGYLTSSDLSEYAKTSDLASYATVAALDDYVTSSAFTTALADYATQAYVNQKIAGVYIYKGSVDTVDNLPTSDAEVGDVYNVNDTGANYAWTGSEWDNLGGIADLSSYVTNESLTSTLANYVTSETLAGYGYLTSSALDDYVTSTSLTTTLSDYVLSSDLTNTLAGYATVAALDDYVPNTILDTLVTKSGNQGVLSGYQAVTRVESDIAITNSSPDYIEVPYNLQITLDNGNTGEIWRKTVYALGDFGAALSAGDAWKWSNDENLGALSGNSYTTLEWHSTFGIIHHTAFSSTSGSTLSGPDEENCFSITPQGGDVILTISSATNNSLHIWENITEGTVVTLAAGESVTLKEGNIYYFYGVDVINTLFNLGLSTNAWSFSGDGTVKIGGNINALLGDHTVNEYTMANTFNRIFYGITTITDASELILPTETLAQYSYNSMFYACTNLVKPPAEISATTLASSCCNSMFLGCTSLTEAPALPATTLTTLCYAYMFRSCTSLTTAPVLPAEVLAQQSYQWMFNGATSLNNVTCLATDLSATNCVQAWLDGVASEGTFTKASGVEWSTGTSGIPEGWDVVDYEG